MRVPLLVIAALSLAACESLIYKLPTRQGNVLEQKQLDKLEVGMSREQVRFLLGTPMAASPLRNDRWDYIGYYKSPRGRVSSRTVSLHFEGDRLIAIEGAESAAADKALERPDVETILEEEEKEKREQQRAEEPRTGVIIGPEQKDPETPEPRETGEPRVD